MNCDLVLAQLDCVRPNSSDLLLPEFADARAHLGICSGCRTEFARRQRFDSAVADLMHHVPISTAHAAKLLETLARTSDDALVLAPELTPKVVRSRRWLTFALVACLLLMLGVVFWPKPTNQLPVGELLARLTLNQSQLAQFDRGFESPQPFEWGAINIDGQGQGQDIDGTPGHDVLLRRFHFDSRRGHVVQGVLVSLPAHRVSPSPAADRFATASPRYRTYEGQPFAAVAWQEGPWVYICLVPNHPGDLELLQRSTQATAA